MMKNKLISGLFIGLCIISLAVNIVAISEIGKLTRTVVPDGPYTVQMGDVFEDAGAEEQVLVQQVLEKMSEDGITLSDEDAQALIDYINEKVEAEILEYTNTVLMQEVQNQTNALLEEKYAEYNLGELTDTQIIQINEEIARELQSRISAFQQSYVLTNDDINRILEAADIDYEMGLYLYQNGYLTDEQLDAFLNSWDYRENFQAYFDGACKNARLMSYKDTTQIVNEVRDGLYDNIKEIRDNINSIELTLQDVDDQLNDIYAQIGIGGASTEGGSITDKISVLQSDVSNLAQTRVTISNYEEYVQNTQSTLTSIQSSITTLAQEAGEDYAELSGNISDLSDALRSQDEDMSERITELETQLERVNNTVIYDIATDGSTLNITTTTVGVKSGNVTP